MANPKHLARIREGVPAWNRWRRRHPEIRPDLSGTAVTAIESEVTLLADAIANEVMPGRAPPSSGDLAGLDLARADLRRCNLKRANLNRSNLLLTDLRHASLLNANLAGCILTSANLSGANLANASLNGAILRFANLRGARMDNAFLRLSNLDGVDATRATLRNVNLAFASITEANFTRADLSGAFVYGISAWNVGLTDTRQENLRITRTNEGTITVDDIKIAQFIYTLITNRNVRDAIDTMTTKLVLILGRFTPERKVVLDAVKGWLRDLDYVPVIFDFERPASRDFTETVVTLAHLTSFIIADVTDPGSIPKELEAIVPRLAVAVQPILQNDSQLYAMFADYWKYDWVLPVYRYKDVPQLRRTFRAKVVRPAERRARELIARRAASSPLTGRRRVRR